MRGRKRWCSGPQDAGVDDCACLTRGDALRQATPADMQSRLTSPHASFCAFYVHTERERRAVADAPSHRLICAHLATAHVILLICDTFPLSSVRKPPAPPHPSRPSPTHLRRSFPWCLRRRSLLQSGLLAPSYPRSASVYRLIAVRFAIHCDSARLACLSLPALRSKAHATPCLSSA